jgi:RimJ/RimL family protein N-acetyltransferase
MITVTKTDNKELIKQIITEPTLWKVMYGQGNDLNNFNVDTTFDYLLIEDSEKGVVGLFQIRALTKMLVECHAYILPEFWGKGLSETASQSGFEYLRNNTKYLKCFTDIPEDCNEVRTSCERIGWKKIGTVENGVIYNGRLQKLDFYEYALTGV